MSKTGAILEAKPVESEGESGKGYQLNTDDLSSRVSIQPIDVFQYLTLERRSIENPVRKQLSTVEEVEERSVSDDEVITTRSRQANRGRPLQSLEVFRKPRCDKGTKRAKSADRQKSHFFSSPHTEAVDEFIEPAAAESSAFLEELRNTLEKAQGILDLTRQLEKESSTDYIDIDQSIDTVVRAPAASSTPNSNWRSLAKEGNRTIVTDVTVALDERGYTIPFSHSIRQTVRDNSPTETKDANENESNTSVPSLLQGGTYHIPRKRGILPAIFRRASRSLSAGASKLGRSKSKETRRASSLDSQRDIESKKEEEQTPQLAKDNPTETPLKNSVRFKQYNKGAQKSAAGSVGVESPASAAQKEKQKQALIVTHRHKGQTNRE